MYCVQTHMSYMDSNPIVLVSYGEIDGYSNEIRMSWVNFRGISRFVFFFFQAEDGIRDLTVTGVQTCALPILPTAAGVLGPQPSLTALLPGYGDAPLPPIWLVAFLLVTYVAAAGPLSYQIGRASCRERV